MSAARLGTTSLVVLFFCLGDFGSSSEPTPTKDPIELVLSPGIFVNAEDSPAGSSYEEYLLTKKQQYKSAYNFQEWEGRNNESISLRKLDIGTLALPSDAEELNHWFHHFRTGERGSIMNEQVIDGWWSKHDMIYIQCIEFAIPADAHEYLLDRWAGTAGPEMEKYRAETYNLEVGDVSFVSPKHDTNVLRLIWIVRNNVFVEIEAEGILLKKIGDIAKRIDAILLEEIRRQKEAEPTPTVGVGADE